LDDHRKEPLKVVDRRLFTREGERRCPAEGEESRPVREPEPQPEKPIGFPAAEGAEVPAADPLFDDLVGFLANSAMMGVRAGAPVAEFSIFIDFLELIRDRMRGRLAPRESEVLDGALGEMKLVYLQLSKKPGGKVP
jgi:hypothetical protein